MNTDSKHWLFLRKGKPGSQLQVGKYYHLQTTLKPRGRRHWLVPQPGSAPLPSTGYPGAISSPLPAAGSPHPSGTSPAGKNECPISGTMWDYVQGWPFPQEGNAVYHFQVWPSKKHHPENQRHPFPGGPMQGSCQPLSSSLQPRGRWSWWCILKGCSKCAKTESS